MDAAEDAGKSNGDNGRDRADATKLQERCRSQRLRWPSEEVVEWCQKQRQRLQQRQQRQQQQLPQQRSLNLQQAVAARLCSGAVANDTQVASLQEAAWGAAAAGKKPVVGKVEVELVENVRQVLMEAAKAQQDQANRRYCIHRDAC